MNTRHATAPLRVAVLAGGDSAEREISLRSGAAVAAALKSFAHQVTTINCAQSPIEDVDWSAFDVCFVALHGGAGEDGRVQEALEHLGVPYTGSSPQASRLAMSKSAAKERFVSCRVPTPPCVSVDRQEPVSKVAVQVESLGYPLVVKPDGSGSSLGLTVVDSADDLPAALAEAFRFDSTAIVEPLVVGREFTVALLDEQALPLVEIVSPERAFSYDAKYLSSLTEYRFDFALPATCRAEIIHAAIAAGQALGTAGLARVDLILDGEGRPWVLEVNTVPGMTPRSLAPQAALRAGYDMAALCDLLARGALEAAEVQ